MLFAAASKRWQGGVHSRKGDGADRAHDPGMRTRCAPPAQDKSGRFGLAIAAECRRCSVSEVSRRDVAKLVSAQDDVAMAASGQRAVAPLMVEQPLLAPEAAGIAGERAVRADHAMAGQDDGAAVEPVGVGDGAHGGGTADALRHFLVGARFAGRNAAQLVPDRLLELGAGVGDLRGEVEIPAGEIVLQLPLDQLAGQASRRAAPWR